ncbi:MAG TPA: transglutaminaseTgpA domain-containing protein [Acidimicrobiales bacterium]|nr:transglutaminaseTgpA domain-containing protein [Acidimicrobiales bacterium]
MTATLITTGPPTTASTTTEPPDRPGGGAVTDIALLAVALAAGLGAARLTRSPVAAHVLLPIAASIVTGHAVTSVARWWRAPDPVPSVAGVLSVALTAIWTLLPSATRGGLPTPTTVRVLLRTFSDAGTVIRSHPTPVPATSGVVLCLAAGAGLAAVFARTLWSWQEIRPPGARRPLIALVPTFGLFCYTALLSSDIDRVTGVTLYLATALVFLAVADRPGLAAEARVHLWHSGTATALVLAVVTVAVPLAASPGLSGLRLDAIPFSEGGNQTGPAGSGSAGTSATGVGALNLIDNMRAVLTSHSDIVMFTATSRTPTYWQLATLSRFDGNAWYPDPATRAAAQSAPQLAPMTLPVLPEPAATHTFTVRVSVAGLRSTLLPVPPDTISVNDSAVVQVEPGIGAIQPFDTPADLTYGAKARLPVTLGTSAAPTLAVLHASVPLGDLDPYLALPPISPAVVRLAHQIVTNVHGPAAQAHALARYFSGGKRFRYTLTPPSVTGTGALASFLFTTRAGFCQQFAGAFAVLARIDGLPTRLAVGFTTGTVQSKNTYTVTGADAHSWPQVYLGPNAGWVSFEPTPSSTNEPTGAGIQGGVPTTLPSHPATRTSTTLAFPRPRTVAQPPLTAGGLGSNARRSSATTTRSASWGPILLALGLIVLTIVGLVIGPRLWRRRRPRLRRRRFARGHPPASEVLARWEQASSVLARTGLARQPSETFEEHAARLLRQTQRIPTSALAQIAHPGPRSGPDANALSAITAYRDLAELAARASYSPDPLTDADVDRARRLSDVLRQALRHGAPVASTPPHL